MTAIGLDYRGERLRLSGDMGYSNNRLEATRPNVTLGAAVTSVPSAVKASSNYAQNGLIQMKKIILEVTVQNMI